MKKTLDADLEVSDDVMEQQVLQAMVEGTFPLSIKVPARGGGERELTLNMRWPDMNDELLIGRLTSSFIADVPLEQVSDADYQIARGRAVIEVLAEAPFGDNPWLPTTDDLVMYRGKRQFRPDTGKVRTRFVIAEFGRAYYSVYSRFQHLALDAF